MPIPPSLRRAAIELYDAYTHTPLPRREFLRRLGVLAGGTVATSSLLALLENHYAHADTVPVDDARLQHADIRFAQLDGQPLHGYLSQPASSGPRPGVVLIHENRGLNPHIRDVARRLALAGFTVLAPDYLSTQGGTPSDEDRARQAFAEMDPVLARRISLAALAALRERGATKVGALGFCWGGGQVGQLAIHAADLQAAVVYYGPPPASDEVAAIRAPLLLHYAGLDIRINAMLPAFETALRAAGVRHQLYRYANVDHAFNNDTNPARFNAEAAALAWSRSMAFLHAQLG